MHRRVKCKCSLLIWWESVELVSDPFPQTVRSPTLQIDCVSLVGFRSKLGCHPQEMCPNKASFLHKHALCTAEQIFILKCLVYNENNVTPFFEDIFWLIPAVAQ